MPRVEDRIDYFGNFPYISKFYLLKGYWQVPVTKQAKEIYIYFCYSWWFVSAYSHAIQNEECSYVN